MTLTHELITPEMRTTSRVVAEKFGKLHKDVLRSIENTTKDLPEEFNRRNFAPVTYLDAKGEARPAYQLTRNTSSPFVLVEYWHDGHLVSRRFHAEDCQLVEARDGSL